jgi:hypothetical protein
MHPWKYELRSRWSPCRETGEGFRARSAGRRFRRRCGRITREIPVGEGNNEGAQRTVEMVRRYTCEYGRGVRRRTLGESGADHRGG